MKPTLCFNFLTLCFSAAETDSESSKDEEEEELAPALPSDLKHIPLQFERIPPDQAAKRSEDFYNLLNKRRTVRHFSSEPVPKEIIYNIIKTAGKSKNFKQSKPSFSDILLGVKRVKF